MGTDYLNTSHINFIFLYYILSKKLYNFWEYKVYMVCIYKKNISCHDGYLDTIFILINDTLRGIAIS